MGSIKVWRGEGCRPRLAVEDVLISLPTLRLSRKEGGKKWGTPGAYFLHLRDQKLTEASLRGNVRRQGKGLETSLRVFSQSQRQGWRDNKCLLLATDWWSSSSGALSLSKSADCCPLFCISFVNLNKWKESCVPRTKRECYKGWIIGPAPSDQLLLLIIYWSGIDN